jgi:hypothetical protein
MRRAVSLHADEVRLRKTTDQMSWNNPIMRERIARFAIAPG